MKSCDKPVQDRLVVKRSRSSHEGHKAEFWFALETFGCVSCLFAIECILVSRGSLEACSLVSFDPAKLNMLGHEATIDSNPSVS